MCHRQNTVTNFVLSLARDIYHLLRLENLSYCVFPNQKKNPFGLITVDYTLDSGASTQRLGSQNFPFTRQHFLLLVDGIYSFVTERLKQQTEP